MADSKISALTDGGRGLFDDLLVSARGAANRKHTVEDAFGYLAIGHPRRRMVYWNDMFARVGTSAAGYGMTETTSGTGAAWSSAAAAGEANRPGILNASTGTTATGRCSIQAEMASILLGGGPAVFEAAVRVPTLSAAAERFQLLVGFFDTNSAIDQVDAAAILYDEGGVATGSAASANWQLMTAANSVRTFTTSATAVPSNTFVTLRIEVNAAGTSVEFFADGVSLGTITTNIPTAAGRQLGFAMLLIKSVGTTARTADIDYLGVEIDFTTARA